MIADGRSEHLRPSGGIMFHDTTRLRMMSRPSLKDALQSFSAAGSTKLGRVGVSQSFRERMTTPARPTEPPPPPPPSIRTSNGEANPSYSLAKKFFSFNKTEIRRINKFLGISNPGDGEMKQQESHIYDIAENDEGGSELGKLVVNNSTFYTGDAATADPAVKKKNASLRLRPKSNEFSLGAVDPVKPPRSKRERSKSFTPRSNPKQKVSIFNRSLSHIPKSESGGASTGGGKHVSREDSCKKTIISSPNDEEAGNHSKRTLSSSDLVHIFPEEERRSFKDIRKILSSPSISSSTSSSTNQIYRPKSQLSNSSSVINSIKEEQVEILPSPHTLSSEHIYEEIADKETLSQKRPLPPLPPAEKQSSPSRTSPILSSDQSSPVKSIFEGASKYDILNYLEDARERGLTDCDLDLEEEEEDDDDEGGFRSTAENVEDAEPSSTVLVLSSRNHSNRVSAISNVSNESSNSSSDGEPVVVVANKEKLSSVEIERNDSGLGSETGRGRVTTKVVVRKRSEDEGADDLACIDCDQVLEVLNGER